MVTLVTVLIFFGFVYASLRDWSVALPSFCFHTLFYYEIINILKQMQLWSQWFVDHESYCDLIQNKK